MNNSTVGIMMPVYNGYYTIIKSIDSLIAQSFKDWVCVIVNDGSTDETTNLLNSISDKRFYIITLKENLGRGAARRIALSKLVEFNVHYICILDADDIYLPGKLEWQVQIMSSNKSISLLSSSLGVTNNHEELVRVLDISNDKSTFYYDNYMNYKPVPFASSILRVSDINGVTFDEKMRFAEDQDFLQRFLLSKHYIFVPKLSYLYSRDFSFSIKKYKESLNSEYYTFKKFNFSKISILKKRLIISIKIYIVTLLDLLNLQHLYLSNFGRKPTASEMAHYGNYITSKKKSKSLEI